MNPADPKNKPQDHPTTPPPGIIPPRLNPLTQPLTALLLLSVLSMAVYFNTFSYPFHFDDIPNISDNPVIKNLSNLLNLSGSRYVGFLSFALNYHFGRLNLFGYHLVNLLIHITNGFLVYLLVQLLVRASNTSEASPPTTAPWIALASALLFVVHPIQTQAVTYIVQRFAALAALFYLLTVVCYLHWRLSPPDRRSRYLWYAGALFATILAMKTKENTFTLPFMLLLVEAVFFVPLTRKHWFSLIPFLLTLPIIPLSLPGALGEGEAGFASETTDISRWDYLLTQFRVIVTYLRLLIFPVHQNLDYDYPVSHSLFDPPVLLSFLFLFALFALAIYLLLSSRLTPHAFPSPLTPSASRLTAFGILWFFLTLSIESSIIPIRDVIYEHRLYLPSVGLWLAAGIALVELSRRRTIMGVILVGALVTVFSVATYQRNKIWQDGLTLWTDVVQKSPQKARGYNNLGATYADRNRWSEAIQEYNTALTLKPNLAEAHNNLGLAYKGLGQYNDATQEYKTALSLKPDYDEAHNNLGMVYYDQGKLSEALMEFEKALQIKSDNAIAYNNRGNVYKKIGRLNDALREYRRALSLDPDFAEAHNNLGVVFQDSGRFNEAIEEYQAALRLKTDYAEAHNNLGVIYKNTGHLDEAVREYQAALVLSPDNAETHNNLGVVYKKLERLDEAVRQFNAALSLKPDYAEIHNNIGNVFQKQGHRDEAIREYQTALTLKPDYAEAQANLALVYYEQGKKSEALAALEEAIRLKPDYAEAHNNLGDIYRGLGRLKEAIREFEIALKLKPDMAEAYYNLGQAYQRMGQTQEAILAYERALKINPGYEMARQALNSFRH
jgi:tetratricopeptide (TPR) repeat protein